MYKLAMILLAMTLSSAPVQAETVFDQGSSFTIAKAIKFGRSMDAKSSVASQGTSAVTGGVMKEGKGKTCASNQFLNNGKCKACPKYADCNGKTFVCHTNYYTNGLECAHWCGQTTCVSGFTKVPNPADKSCTCTPQ